MEEGNNTPIELQEIQDEAVSNGIVRAQKRKTEVVIHNDHGLIEARYSYRKHRRHRRCQAMTMAKKVKKFLKEYGSHKVSPYRYSRIRD